jgi:hypothetical protein
MPSVTCKPYIQSVVMLSVVMLSDFMLSVIMLSVVMLNVVMLSVVAPDLGCGKTPLGYALSLLTNMRLGCNCLPMTNTLAYFERMT